MYGILNIDEKKLITQFDCNLRDESFEPSWSLIVQYLSNTNESATIAKTKFFRELKKALI